MEQIIGFERLKIGQRLKIKGKYQQDSGTFTALEIEALPFEEESSLMGMLEHIDHDQKIIRLLGRDFRVPGGAEVKDLMRQDVALTDFREGAMVKLKGRFLPSGEFIPRLVKMKETFGFNIDKLKGEVAAIDPQANTLLVNGITVKVDPKTALEGI